MWYSWVSLVAQLVTNLPAMRDLGLIPGLVRSLGEGNGYPLQYSGLENSGLYSPWGRKGSDMTERLLLMRKLRDNEHNMFLFKDKEIGFLEIETFGRSG